MNNSDSKEKINDGLINHEGILSNNLNLYLVLIIFRKESI